MIITKNLNLRTNIISFDNLAIEQLNLKELPDFNMYYQGPDGKFSLYIDAVEKLIGKSSFNEHLDTFGHRDLNLSYYLNYWNRSIIYFYFYFINFFILVYLL